MLGTLIKKELAGFGNTIMNSGKQSSRSRKKKNAGNKVLIGLVLLYFVGILCLFFYHMADMMCETFVSIGLDWAYFSIMSVMSLTFCIIGGAMTAYSTVYKAKDNEFLLSLPIRPSMILSTRVLICYGVDFAINAIITVVTMVVYGMHYSLTAPMIIGNVVSIIFFPIAGLVLSLLLGWLIALATSKVPPEKKSYVSLAFVLVFMVVYIYFYIKMMDIVDLILSATGKVAGFLETWIKPVYWEGQAATGDYTSMLLLAVVSVIAFSIIYMILSVSFIKITTTNKGTKKVKYKEEQLKTSDANGALLGREFLRFRRNTTVMVNFGLSLLLLVIMAVALVIFKGKALDLLGNFGEGMNDIVVLAGLAAIMYILAMCPITAPSISLEANTLWLLKSLPITSDAVLAAKLKSHLYLTLPVSLLATGAIIYVAEPSVLIAVFAIACVAAFNFFMATWGLRLNISKPLFTWNNEAAAVKRSASVTITMLGAMGIIITLAVVYIVIGSETAPELYIGITTLVLALLAFVNYRWIKTKGVEKFEEM